MKRMIYDAWGKAGRLVEDDAPPSNPLASQQPAPIPDQALATNMRKSMMVLCDVVDGWQKKCGELEKALQRIRSCDPKNGHVMKGIAIEALSTPLGTPGKGEK